MNFNKEQREGLAKVSDNLATASIVSAMVGGFIDHKVGWQVVTTLVILCFVLLFVAYLLRKGDEDGN